MDLKTTLFDLQTKQRLVLICIILALSVAIVFLPSLRSEGKLLQALDPFVFL